MTKMLTSLLCTDKPWKNELVHRLLYQHIVGPAVERKRDAVLIKQETAEESKGWFDSSQDSERIRKLLATRKCPKDKLQGQREGNKDHIEQERDARRAMALGSRVFFNKLSVD
jgi:hypothetical protein